MPSTEVKRFIDALQTLESSGEFDHMLSLFSDDCVVGNVLVPDRFHGRNGAATFWQDYLGSFGEIRSAFRTEIVDEERAALEWVAQGATTTGNTVRYQGITVLEFQDGKIKRFMSYFDPRSLGRQFEGTATAAMESV